VIFYHLRGGISSKLLSAAGSFSYSPLVLSNYFTAWIFLYVDGQYSIFLLASTYFWDPGSYYDKYQLLDAHAYYFFGIIFTFYMLNVEKWAFLHFTYAF